ncbi:type IV pili methyl-accepting chemotaxis transducer N-terminal domain-containing protein [Iodobacter sp.]|uniref:type IV pili methyl-accepting chemotaxis transducer N-terminal domain-containing protein n=1 Tax=Iodobacter sp. TaxID=1915058 RepID=UPI0025E9AB66|nr:type IV pili methyl-accepting chemotaxis transducer N-terminal domain-containing protein [Iodobacter sp.]
MRIILIPFLLLPLMAHATVLSPSAAISAIGGQRMLTQRIVKAYCQQGRGIQSDAAKLQISSSITQFSTQLSNLLESATAPESIETVKKQETQWQNMRTLALTPPKPETAKQLDDIAEVMQYDAGELAKRLEASFGKPQGKLIRIAGRQRMLSQRLAKTACLQTWGKQNPALKQQQAQAQKEFSAGLLTLRASPQNTPSIIKQLDLAQMQWVFLENALSGLDSDADKNIASTSERLLEVMDKIASQYEKMGN